MRYDVVIDGGTIIEPKTKIQTVGRIGIKDDRISIITREKIDGDIVIDARERIVCPGFIDIHSHLNYSLYPAWLAVRQGVTTCLSGNCGITPKLPIREYLDDIEKQGYPINFATLAGHSWKMREMVGLTDPYETANARQTAEMVRLAEEALEDGAFGISLGLEYAPGASSDEYMPLVELAARYDKLVPIHIRTDALDFAHGLREAIAMSEKTGAKVHISHLAYQFGVHPEVTEMALCMITNAIEKGLPIMCDSGIYEAFSTIVQSAVFDEGWHKRYNVTLNDLMISSGKYTGQRATQEIYNYVRTQEKETIGTAFVGVMPDLARAIKHPATMISTDAGLSDKPGEGHPQDSGTYPRVFQKLVREQGVLSIMEAVAKSSRMPAVRMGISNTKGWLGTGADADIVIFNPSTIADHADYVGIGRPDAPPSGIDYVIVNGKVVADHGEILKNVLPGKVLRQKNTAWTL